MSVYVCVWALSLSAVFAAIVNLRCEEYICFVVLVRTTRREKRINKYTNFMVITLLIQIWIEFFNVK